MHHQRLSAQRLGPDYFRLNQKASMIYKWNLCRKDISSQDTTKKFAHHQAEYQISLVPRLLCHAREPGNEAKYQIRHVIVKGWCAPGKCSKIFEKKKILALHAKANILIMNSNSFWNIKSTLLHVEYSWSSANLFEILYFFDGILHCCFLFVGWFAWGQHLFLWEVCGYQCIAYTIMEVNTAKGDW